MIAQQIQTCKEYSLALPNLTVIVLVPTGHKMPPIAESSIGVLKKKLYHYASQMAAETWYRKLQEQDPHSPRFKWHEFFSFFIPEAALPAEDEDGPFLYSDMSKVNFGKESTTFRQMPRFCGFQQAGDRAFVGLMSGAEGEVAVYYGLYLDACERLRAIVPLHGNTFNPHTNAALGKMGPVDEEYCKSIGVSIEDLLQDGDDHGLVDYGKMMNYMRAHLGADTLSSFGK